MARAFTDQLRDLRRGAFVAEAEDVMAQLVGAVSATGKPGKLVIELTVKRAAKSTLALVVADKITIKAPPDGIDNETLMFPTPEGSLLTEDPSQKRLDLKVPAAPPVEQPRVVGESQ